MKYIVLKKIGNSYYSEHFIFSSENEAKACVALLNDGGADQYKSYCYAEIKVEL